MNFDRESGILLHITSLPSKYGIGELGGEAYGFIDFLARSRQRLWQILPLGPVGYGESPYQCFSAFAGNALLISIDKLMEQGFLFQDDIGALPHFDTGFVEFERVRAFKQNLYRKAFERFKATGARRDYSEFLKENGFWLEDFSFFMALKGRFGGVAWNFWENGAAFREPEAMGFYKDRLYGEIEYQKFLQFIFFSQWAELKTYANKKRIKIIGDLPLFISYDSSDAWAKRSFFELDNQENPIKIAGVPPDYFSNTGQLWGNPHYKWDEMEKDGFRWWRDRLELMFRQADIVRIDHFRGLESYWEIPGGEKTAEKGRWVKAPGMRLLRSLKEHKSKMPIIAEDLGIISKEVEEMRDTFGFPGMKVLQFAFSEGAGEDLLPHNYTENTAVYTGTHDNDTVSGWYSKAEAANYGMIERLKKYFNINREMNRDAICRILVESALDCKANIAIIPMQDLLCLGSEARMNIPGTIGGNNWRWRLDKGLLLDEVESRLVRMSVLCKRNGAI